jgi:hypothetical protein
VAGIVTECPGRPITSGVVNTDGNNAKPFLLPQNPCVKVQKIQARLVIVWLTVADVLPQASTAFHVLVSSFVPPLPIEVTSETKFTVAPLQASDAVGAVKLGVAVQSIVTLAPA